MTILVRPHDGPETQAFGNTQPNGEPHAGTDYGYSDGKKIYPDVYAAAAGTVIFAGDARNLGWPNISYTNPDFDRTDAQDSSAGNIVIIDHGDGLTTYNHLATITVAEGVKVFPRQRIGTTGDTGYAFGKHLHFEWIPRPFNYATRTYGRTAPTFYTFTTQSTETKDWFEMATEAQLRKVVREEIAKAATNPWTYKNAKLERDDAYALLRATRTAALAAAKDLKALLAKGTPDA